MADNTKNFSAGEVIFKEGEKSAEAYILLSGTLEVRKGNEKIAELSENGLFIGEMAVLIGKPRTATVVAKTDCVLGIVTKENFSTMVQKMPTVAFKLAKSIAERLEETTNELVKLKEKKEVLPSKDKSKNEKSEDISNDTEQLLVEAQKYFDEMDFDDAEKIWEKALKNAKDNNDKYMLYNNIGSCYLLRHDVKKAMLHFAKALKINPSGKEIMLNFALVYLLLGDHKRAENLLNKVIKIFPDCNVALENLKILKGTEG
jgi:CRP/FNR family cyclic AMP-dependent transcriptional regulator